MQKITFFFFLFFFFRFFTIPSSQVFTSMDRFFLFLESATKCSETALGSSSLVESININDFSITTHLLTLSMLCSFNKF